VNNKTVLSSLRYRQRRDVALSWFCVVIVLALTYLIRAEHISSPDTVVAAVVVLMSLVVLADFAFAPVPKCPKCRALLSLALRGKKKEREGIRYCPYCATDLDVEM